MAHALLKGPRVPDDGGLIAPAVCQLMLVPRAVYEIAIFSSKGAARAGTVTIKLLATVNANALAKK
jgi:hypothetical protein